MRKLVYGVGINDADYAVQPTVNGKQIACPFYNTWKGMLSRAYSSRWHARFPTYLECSVAKEWHSFMTFRKWMIKQDWEGKHLDKDILFYGNKHYSSERCLFIPQSLNKLLSSHGNINRPYGLGVSFRKKESKFFAEINIEGGRVYLGSFTSEIEAHKAWQNAKLNIIKHTANKQDNEKIKNALMCRVEKLDFDIKNNRITKSL